MKFDPKWILMGASLVITVIGAVFDDKKQSLEIQEEVAKQMAERFGKKK